MIEHVWSVLCASSTIDKDNNSLSLFNVIEEIRATARAAPGPGDVLPVHCEIVSLWRRAEGQPEMGEARVTLVAEGENTGPLSENYPLDLSALRLRSRLVLDGLPISGSGVFRLVVEHRQGDGEWVVDERIPFDVNITVLDLADST
jgi:hypothetical protein